MKLRYINPDRKLLTIMLYFKKSLGLKANERLYELLVNKWKPKRKEYFPPCLKNDIIKWKVQYSVNPVSGSSARSNSREFGSPSEIDSLSPTPSSFLILFMLFIFRTWFSWPYPHGHIILSNFSSKSVSFPSLFSDILVPFSPFSSVQNVGNIQQFKY